jgi:hypothetical protein
MQLQVPEPRCLHRDLSVQGVPLRQGTTQDFVRGAVTALGAREIAEAISHSINQLAALLVELRDNAFSSATRLRTIHALEELNTALVALDEGTTSGVLASDVLANEADRAEARRLEQILRTGLTRPETLPLREIETLVRRTLAALGIRNVDDMLPSEKEHRS